MIENEASQAYLRAAGLSVCGQSRKNNQDAVYFDIDRVDSTAQQLGLFIICDGLGGHQAGALASQTAISEIVAALTLGPSLASVNDLNVTTIHQLINAAIVDANARIHQKARGLVGTNGKMGTTVALTLVYGGVAYMANVGDSRIYLLRQNQASQITHDHSLAAELARYGYISHDEIVGHPHRNVLTRALGVAEEVKVDQYVIDLAPGDRLLLCTDGLWQAFPAKSELVRMLDAEETLESLIQPVVAEALQRDGSDNVSAILVSVDRIPSSWQQARHGENSSSNRHNNKPVPTAPQAR